MPEAEACAVAIVDDSALSANDKLAAALNRADFWDILRRAQAGRPPDQVRIVVKPELAGFAVGSPTVTDPRLVERLIDLLHDRGFSNVAVVGTADSSALWAENRDLYALSDLLGYRYVTPKGRGYEIVDLAGTQDEAAFPVDCALRGSGIARQWLDADMRMVFSKSRTDEAAGYALCLDTLIGVLPLIDKDLHYRKRRRAGDVVAPLLRMAPVQFCLIDAIVGAHGAGGRRAPVAIATHTIIAASDIVLADYVGALKMGLDPETSPTFARIVRTHPLPKRYIVAGPLGSYRNWENVPAMSLQAAGMRNRAETLDRLVEPWLQRLDPELFPLKHPLDGRLNAMLAEFFADSGDNATGQWLLMLVNTLLACIGEAIGSYRTLFDKDALRRRAVPLGIDLDAIPDGAFAALVEELLHLEPVAARAPLVSDELGWQYLDEAVVFRYMRTVPIDYDLFVWHVDIARTIQFMNDYLGGVLVALAHDRSGRPVRQAERNIYLPQPNYLVLYQGKPIDVSKLEVVEYGANRHRLFWKTVLSENNSATYDDGIATFERTTDGTRITITGRQQFTLPPFWQVFDPSFVPGLKDRLVTHAYQTFFDRTIANFEALVEGRDIRIGRPVDEPAPLPAEQIMTLLHQIGEIAMPLLQQLSGKHDPVTAGASHRIDADGFVHITPAQSVASDPEQWAAEVTRFIDGLGQAVRRDLTTSHQVA
ncbi:MAG TPA: DUF362 domain-containing protein [Acetobacteraceae bacterium]|nr:DUF362 domain-containing protein [Acetobacteraceae bacterium]